jgi:hypothetical protein
MRTVRYLLMTAAVALLAGCGSGSTAQPDPTPPAAMELPDGRTATPEQSAFLEDVTASLSEEKARDVLFVLSEGESVCRLWDDPSDPTQQRQAVDLFLDTGYGWTQTEATVMVRAATEHFC